MEASNVISTRGINYGEVEMDIESNLVSLLDDTLPNNDTKKRNIEIIPHFYGFRSEAWPTLDETSRQFNGIATRERIRQIKKEGFLDKVNASDFPTLDTLKNLIETRPYWTSSALQDVLTGSGLISGSCSIPGLFSLMKDIGVQHQYEIYTPELKKATRNSYSQHDQHLILAKSSVPAVKKVYGRVRSLPGRYGITNLVYLVRDNPEFQEYMPLLKAIIRDSKDIWYREEGEDFWYIFENRDNSLINFSEKVFSVFRECPVDRLAEAYENALSARKYEYPFPSKELIAEYLRSSSLFDYRSRGVRYRSDTSGLTGIENEVVEYYKKNGEFTYKEIAPFLVDRGYGEPYIDRTIYKSPLIHIDRSDGQGNYIYRLVGEATGALTGTDSEARYWEFREKLAGIENTDADAQTQSRREQGILQRWLFEGKTQEVCTICGERYMVGSLVTAHKKRRSICTTEERLDPYIVMPLCLFGCDYLYENQYILIQEGIVTRGGSIESADKEHSYIENLVGREIPHIWRQGPQDYFRSLDS